ncbi:MAG: shikimate kinase [Lysobacterales bacterium]
MDAPLATVQPSAPPWPCPGRHLVLIGPMGAGKSTVGRQLSRLLRAPFVDLDERIERVTGATIPLIFELEGEAGFRRRESEVLSEVLAQAEPQIIATGGGAVLAEANRAELARYGLMIYLRTPVELQLRRLARDCKRPLLQAPDREQRLQRMAIERNPIYEALANVSIESGSDNPSRTARRLAQSQGWLPPCPTESDESPDEST